jgi:DNA polymerase-3 subunit chi
MTEIWFYHLQRQPLEKAVPQLIEKSLDRGWRAIVQAKSEERLDALDSWLWTYSDESFLAHGRAGDGDCALQPLFDGNSEEELTLARMQWKELKAQGFAVTYWQQSGNGRWEKKA